ncbi:MAG: hypothetical protein KH135_02390 [Firmicutes bacterium]|nr:hypothetical protein [Bacillota bacterium]
MKEKKKRKFTPKRLLKSLKSYQFKKASLKEIKNGKEMQFYISRKTGFLLQLIAKDEKIVDGRLYGELKDSDLLKLDPKTRNQIIYHNFHLQFCGKVEENQIIFKITPQLPKYLKILETVFHTTYEPQWKSFHKFNHNSLPLWNPCLEESDSYITEKIKKTLDKLNYRVKKNLDKEKLKDYRYQTPRYANKMKSSYPEIDYCMINYGLNDNITKKEKQIYEQQKIIIKKLDEAKKNIPANEYLVFLEEIPNLLDYYGISGIPHSLSELAKRNQMNKRQMWEKIQLEMKALNIKARKREHVNWDEFYKKRNMEYNIFRYPNKEFKYLIDAYGLFGKKKKEVVNMSASEIEKLKIAERDFNCIVAGNQYRIEGQENPNKFRLKNFHFFKKRKKETYKLQNPFSEVQSENRSDEFLKEQAKMKLDVEKLKKEFTEEEYYAFLNKYDFLLRYYDLKPQLLSEEYIQQKLNVTPEDENEYHQQFERELIREKIQLKYEKESVHYRRTKRLLSEIDMLLSDEHQIPGFISTELETQLTKR